MTHAISDQNTPGLPPPGILQTYRAKLAAGALKDDTGQRLAVELLQLLHTRLVGYAVESPRKVRMGFFGWGRERLVERRVPGLYLYGGVGRGKSMLMDLFFETAPVWRKRRVHFHAFMQDVHAAIHRARKSDHDDPIPVVADAIAEDAHLLCFDEMQITDITDAMIVGRLFERLFERAVVVVATSNRAPEDLYKDGLNRHLFLPFIEILKTHLEVHELESPTDHRQARLRGMEVYHTPLGPASTAALDTAWTALAGGPGAQLTLPRQGRDIVLGCHLNGVTREDFAALCEAPLGPGDYLAIAAVSRVLILDGIPRLSREKQNAAKRFVTLIDALYEAHVRLIAAAEAEPEALYTEGAGAFEFERTASRLNEMRSVDWSGASEGGS
ncbi:MAG: cell division protein ZapE [Pseudomonadota bacterium]